MQDQQCAVGRDLVYDRIVGLSYPDKGAIAARDERGLRVRSVYRIFCTTKRMDDGDRTRSCHPENCSVHAATVTTTLGAGVVEQSIGSFHEPERAFSLSLIAD